MTNFSVNFSNPWLLFLLIPAIGLALIPYFRLDKQYRRNRNRVCSVVLHCIIMTMCVALVAGISFTYDVPNKQNEIILLVDSSYSNRESGELKENFIQSVVNDCGNDFRLGIVKFGYDQIYAAPLSDNSHEVYEQYLSSGEPDTAATDIASALKYTSGLFTSPQTAKIVLISDGLETDNKASSVIKAISAMGIKVDVVNIPNAEYDEIEVIGVTTPDHNLVVGELFTMELTLRNNMQAGDNKVQVTVYDNDIPSDPVTFDVLSGVQTVQLQHTFEETGMHKLRFAITNPSDTTEQNNTYFAYIYMRVFNRVLVVESREGESEDLQKALGGEYEITSYSTEQDVAFLPKTVEELCAYDQVILVNIANDDMPAGFDLLLNTYVYELGGGLFTVGGTNDSDNDGNVIPHAYNRDDMYGSLYQQMLPVQVINYTPPVAVVMVIDCSGSMGEDNLYLAKQGALSCLDALTSQDYCGVVAFDSSASEELQVTPVSQREKIREKILSMPIEGSGATIFSTAIQKAGQALAGVDVDKRHIILVTDGGAGDKPEDYNSFIDINYANGITMSIVTVDAMNKTEMDDAARRGGGVHYPGSSWQNNGRDLADAIYTDLVDNAISEIAYGEPFTMKINKINQVVTGIEQADLDRLPLYGYYGTRLKEGAEAGLMGEYVPMYAQWKYGKGSVGSFMSAFNKEWSGDLLQDEKGIQLVRNMVNGLFPTEEVKVQDIKVVLREENYISQLNVYTAKAEDDEVSVRITPLSTEAAEFYSDRAIPITASDGYTRFTFEITCPGLYEITVEKKGGAGTSTLTLYKTFSYSKEYEAFRENEEAGVDILAAIAKDGKGAVITDSLEIFVTFEKVLHRVYDPRLVLLILSAVLFLLDIAVRKFKFKWPHEIIRDHKAKKELMRGKEQ